MIAPEDVSIYKICNTPEEGVECVRFYYSTYNSMRQVRRRLVLRLEKELTDGDVDALYSEFGDIIVKGRIEKSGPLPEEANEPELAERPRLVFSYSQARAARLNQMILRINELGDHRR